MTMTSSRGCFDATLKDFHGKVFPNPNPSPSHFPLCSCTSVLLMSLVLLLRTVARVACCRQHVRAPDTLENALTHM